MYTRALPQKNTHNHVMMFEKTICKQHNTYELGLFGMLKLALALQFIVTNTYFSVARMLTLVLHATLK